MDSYIFSVLIVVLRICKKIILGNFTENAMIYTDSVITSSR